MAEDRTVKRSFRDHDTLGREKFANFLIEVMKNGQSEEGSYTLAIDAPYGSGKTWFLQMLENKINEEYASTKQDVPLVAVRYDAWKYDYFDEPLEPLVEQIMQAPVMVDEKAFEGAKVALKKAVAGVKALAKFDWTDVAEDLPGWLKMIPAVVEAYEAGEYAGAGLHEEARKLKRYQSALDNLQEVLHEAAVTYGETAKLVVIIDELDRCRPDFAIRTLEVTKHLLASENVVFLYAIDMKQLSRTVESLYGAGMNSEGYLLRLFNHISILPALNKSTYLNASLKDMLSEERLCMIVDEIHYQRHFLQLTYRDIDRIVSSYKILLGTLLKNYSMDEAYLLYFYLLTLKYAKRGAFNYLLFRDHDEEARGHLGEYPHVLNESLRDAVVALTSHSTLRFESLLANPLAIRVPAGMAEGDYKRYLFTRTSPYLKTYGYYTSDDGMKNNEYQGFFGPVENVSGLIFHHDIDRLFQMGDGAMTIGEYLHQQLEMYNYESRE